MQLSFFEADIAFISQAEWLCVQLDELLWYQPRYGRLNFHFHGSLFADCEPFVVVDHRPLLLSQSSVEVKLFSSVGRASWVQ